MSLDKKPSGSSSFVKNRHLKKILRIVWYLVLGLFFVLTAFVGLSVFVAMQGAGWHSPFEIMNDLLNGWTLGKLIIFIPACIGACILGFGIGLIIARYSHSD